MEPHAAKRVFLLDELRGFAILCMVVYHGVFDFIVAFHWDFPFFFSPFMNTVRDLFAGLFILISGIVCRYSRSNRKRGLLCFSCGLLMTAVTLVILPDEPIYFGILHLLGSSMLLFSLMEPLIDRIPRAAAIGIFFLLFAFTYGLPYRQLGFFSYPIFQFPADFSPNNYFCFLGIINGSFASADFFPLFPWLFLFLLGTVVGLFFREHKMPACFYRSHIPFLGAVGRKTLWIYLLHQPILFLLMLLYSALSGASLGF